MEAPPSLLELDLSKLRVIRGKPGQKGITFHNVSLDGKPLRFTLLPIGQATKIPFKPSVYQGTGLEQRVNLQLEISNKLAEVVGALEDAAREQLDCKGWNSVLKTWENGSLLKAKLNLSGTKQTAISGVPELPSTWPLHGNVCIEISTIYAQKQAAGLILETEALEIHPQTPATSPFQT